MRLAYRIFGIAALGLGFAGLFLPLLPTVPFVLLAAFCFARSNPAWEARLLAHPTLGPHIQAWRANGSISRKGKIAAVAAFARIRRARAGSAEPALELCACSCGASRKPLDRFATVRLSLCKR